MNVLRDNKDSVMAMLEAFVYDPLISWKLLGQGKDDDPVLSDGVTTAGMSGYSPVSKVTETMGSQEGAHSLAGSDSDVDELEKDDAFILSPGAAAAELTRRESFNGEEEGGLNEDINSRLVCALALFENECDINPCYCYFRALEVITRIQAMLTGRDFAKSDLDPDLTVDKQVDRLIKEATNVENLCQLYQGWCPLW
jgi:FKBP12-rapamycin complex-associated protein